MFSRPSNFVRIQELFGDELNDLLKKLAAVSISDDEIRDAIGDLDPHGAVGYRALQRYLTVHSKKKGIFLHTAHPAKFDSVADIIGDLSAFRPLSQT